MSLSVVDASVAYCDTVVVALYGLDIFTDIQTSKTLVQLNIVLYY